jgi:predicted amidohydrolase YtcJ
MVNRVTASGAPFNQGEAITALEAVRAYTVGSAYASHAERNVGTIAPGMLADLVVLSANPTRVPPPEISDISVLATYIDGTCRWSHDPSTS